MITDHYLQKWEPYVPQIWTDSLTRVASAGNIPVEQTPITQAEVDEFRRLLERAREYDRRNQEPDCEQQEKREALKKIADQLGVDISFV
jgi:protein tyrosine phosphatase (PTP) superfamily phosphohydrolase (DUF442 family)